MASWKTVCGSVFSSSTMSPERMRRALASSVFSTTSSVPSSRARFVLTLILRLTV